jgi:hypothetical protein
MVRPLDAETGRLFEKVVSFTDVVRGLSSAALQGARELFHSETREIHLPHRQETVEHLGRVSIG